MRHLFAFVKGDATAGEDYLRRVATINGDVPTSPKETLMGIALHQPLLTSESCNFRSLSEKIRSGVESSGPVAVK